MSGALPAGRQLPTFSVIVAAYNRSRHILPSIHSILNQKRQDFELIIVGDCCTDDTADAIRPFLSSRVRWFNLPENSGSQSLPNNAGIAESRGDYIAYIGHDDIWAPDHLSALAALLEPDPTLDFAVSGTIYHGPRASNFRAVTGIFGEEQAGAARQHFFPPSSLAHRRDVVDRIGLWKNPREIIPPVDADFQLRAVHAGMRFASTQRVTVHKFAAGHRYLYYLKQTSDEQHRMLRRIPAHGYACYVTAELAKAKAAGTFMIVQHPDYGRYEKGQLTEHNARNRGVVRPELRRLARPELVEQDNHPRSLDWQHFKAGGDRTRWAGLNPRPKLLIPFNYDGRADIRLSLRATRAEALECLKLSVNGVMKAARISHMCRHGDVWSAEASVKAPLRPDTYTVLELHLNKAQRSAGLGVAAMGVIPLEWRHLPVRLGGVIARFLRRRRRPS